MASPRSRKLRFRFLEHKADAYIAAYGASLEECFENAALALFETMTDTGKVRKRVKEEIEVSAPDLLALLYAWLERLLILFETQSRLYSAFDVLKVEKLGDGWTFHAKVWGEPFDRAVHPQRTEVKAVTYHQMRIAEKKGRVVARFILDL